MSRCLFIHDFFRDGRLDVLDEVRELQVCGQWTKEKRAAWIKQAKVAYEHAKRDYPLGRSYNAGRIAGLKSAITADFPTLEKPTHSRMVFLILPDDVAIGCLSCGDEASWKCYPDGKPKLTMSLCHRCKQEWERYALAQAQGRHEDMLTVLSPVLTRLLCSVLLAITQSAFVFIVLVALTLGETLWLEDMRELPPQIEQKGTTSCHPD